MLQVSHLTKYYGTERILNKISFGIERGHKVALVGFNGTGKTTMLKILAGIVEVDSGKIEFQPNITVGFLPQDSNEYNKENVLAFLKKYVGKDDEEFIRNIEIMFAGFGLQSVVKNKKIGDLSSGQKTKVFLTAILLKKPDLLLLDEPTNNLDLPALIWLEDYLQRFKNACIIVSHDRKFLDNVTNKIFELNWTSKDITISNGMYTNFLNQKAKEVEKQFMRHDMQRDEINRIQVLAEQKRQDAIKGAKWKGTDNDHMLIGFKRDRAGNSFKDSKVLYNRIKRMDIIEKPVVRKDLKIKLSAFDDGASKDFLVKDLICGYDDGFRVGPINLDLKFGNKICILGLNGSGKSTFLKTLMGIIPKISGSIEIAKGIKFGNLMQEHESLPTGETLINFLKKRTKQEENIMHNHLVHFGFSEWQLTKKIKTLSPGGRARLILAYFSLTDVNVLVLDEPTNHLDIEAGMALEVALENFTGSVLVVTHDRYFVEKTKLDTIYVLENSILNKVDDFAKFLEEMGNRSKKLIRLLK